MSCDRRCFEDDDKYTGYYDCTTCPGRDNGSLSTHTKDKPRFKDHEIQIIVNKLRDTAIKYKDCQCLREAISKVIVPILKGC